MDSQEHYIILIQTGFFLIVFFFFFTNATLNMSFKRDRFLIKIPRRSRFETDAAETLRDSQRVENSFITVTRVQRAHEV